MIKVLIADDERVEIQALEKMVREYFPECEILPSVMDGMSLVKSVNENSPDVVIVDINMPLLSGLDALEVLRSGNLEMEILIHSAYSDFAFMRRAIQMGAADYLVKPVFVDDFKAAFRPLVEKAGQKKGADRAADARQWQETMEKNIMMSCLLGRPDRESWERYHAYDTGNRLPREGRMTVLILWFSGKERELYYSMFAKELKRLSPMLSIVCRDKLICLLSSVELSAVSGRIRSFAFSHDLEYRAGFSSWQDRWEELAGAVTEAEGAFAGATENTCAIYQRTSLHLRGDPFAQLIREAARELSAGKRAEAEKLLLDVLLRETKEGTAPFFLAFYAQKALCGIGTLCRMNQRRTGAKWTLPFLTAALTKAEDALWGDESVPDRLRREVPAEKLKDLLHREVLEMEEDVKLPVRQENAYVSQALVFIRQHYAEDISLQQTADSLGITQFYLSRLFKQELCQTFVELLTQERLTTVIMDLLDPGRNLQSVSASAGYATKYLYRIFRGTFGLTLREFRDAMMTDM